MGGKFSSQNICLEKLPADTLPATNVTSGLCTFNVGSFADFNNDGHPDVAFSGTYGDVIAMQNFDVFGILTSNGSGVFTKDTMWHTIGPYNFVNGDFNEDGNADVFAASPAGPLLLLKGDGTGHFTSSTINSGNTMWSGLTADDFDGDNHTDILASSLTSGSSIVFIRGNGNGTFASPVNFTNSTWTSNFYNGDFDNDGLPDAVIANGLLINNGGGSFSVIPMQKPQGMFDVGDYNMDGNLDMIGKDSIYLGSGAGNFPTKIVYTLPSGVSNFGKTADMNADGILDLMAKRGSSGHDTLLIFTGNGNASFAQTNISIPLDTLSAVGPVGDVDGNGMTDVVMFGKGYADFENCISVVYSILNQTAHITASSHELCSGDSMQLFVNTTDQILWSNGDTTLSIYATAPGNYYAAITTPYGCSSTDSFLVNQIAATNFLPLNSNNHCCFYLSPFTLTGGSPSGGIYSGAGVSNGMFDPQAAGLGTHTLTYTYAGPGGCTGSDSIQVTVDICLGKDQLTVENEQPVIFPNPFNGFITLNGIESPSTVFIYNSMGKLICSKQINAVSNRIDTGELDEGIYFMRVQTSSGSITKKIIKAQ